MKRLLALGLLLSGCGGWGRVRYDSTAALPQRLPASCAVTVKAAPDWLAGAGAMGTPDPRPDDLLASARSTLTEDVQKNICAGGGAGIEIEVELRRLEGRAGPHWGVFTFIGPLLGLPVLTWQGTAGVTVRLRQGVRSLGEYPGSATVKKVMGVYYGMHWRPEDRSDGGVVALALRTAMEDAKARLTADRARIVAAWSGGGPSSPLPAGPVTIAVTDLKPEGVGASDAAILSEVLRGELVKSGAVRVVEKANMEKILAEQAFQQTGCTTQECAVKLGKLLNVRRMVVGTFGKLLGDYVVNVRVVDVETGAAAYADEARGSSSKEIQTSVREMAGRMASAVQ